MNTIQNHDGTIKETPLLENQLPGNEALGRLLNIEQLLNEDLLILRESIELKDNTITRLQEANFQHEKRAYSLVDEGTLKGLIHFKDKIDLVRSNITNVVETITSQLENLNEEFDDLLYGLGVMEIEVDGENYDRNRQKVKKQIPTEEENQNYIVQKVLRPGYQTEKKILRKQEVSIYVYQKPVDNE